MGHEQLTRLLLERQNELRSYRNRLLGGLSSIDTVLSEEALGDPSTWVDAGYTLQQLERLLDELRKDVGRVQRRLGVELCRRILDMQERGGTERGAPMVRGTMASAKATPKITPRLPRSDSPEYAALLHALGVSDGRVIAARVLQVHFKYLSDYLDNLAESGAELPVEVETATEEKVTYYGKRN